MRVASVEALLENLRRSRLLTAAQFAETTAHASQSMDSCDAASIADRLVHEGALTAWQAKCCLAGRHKFFIGKYCLLQPLGAGGMGAVFKAFHRKLDRYVAIKVVRPAFMAGRSENVRFEREIKAAAALSHSNIVSVYDADHAGRIQFLVMEYLDGHDLAYWLRARRAFPIEVACDCVRQAASGLQHAHQHGMVHRDIKPSNLFVTQESASQSPIVKVLDLGLARVTSELSEEKLTGDGQFLGTPDYIAPEQAQDPQTADIRADIFSLGCTLFELVSGQVPYSGDNPVGRLVARMMRDAPRISSLRGVPSALDDIVAKSLNRDPRHRFQTAAELADALLPFSQSNSQFFNTATTAFGGTPKELAASQSDTIDYVDRCSMDDGGEFDSTTTSSNVATIADELLDYLPELTDSGVRIESHQISNVSGARSSRRNVLGVLAIVVIGLGAVFTILAIRPTDPANKAHDASTKPYGPSSWVLNGGPIESPPEAVVTLGDPILKLWDDPTCVAFSPNGQVIAAAGMDGSVTFWDAENGQRNAILPEFEDAYSALGIAFQPKSQQIAVSRANGRIQICNLVTGQVSIITSEENVPDREPERLPLAFSTDGRWLAAGRANGQITVWEMSTLKPQFSLVGHQKEIRAVAFHPKLNVIASSSQDGTTRIWDVPKETEIAKLPFNRDTLVYSLDYHPDGTTLATGDSDFNVRLWDTSNYFQRGTPIQHDADVTAVAFSPDGELLASGSERSGLRLWQPDTGAMIRRIDARYSDIVSLAFSPDSRRIVTAGNDNALKIWNVDTGEIVVSTPHHNGEIRSAAFDPAGTMFATGGVDGRVIVWGVEQQWSVLRILDHDDAIESLCFNHDSKLLFCAGHSGLKAWSIPDWQDTSVAKQPIKSIAYSANSNTLIACCTDESIRFWDADSGDLVRSIDILTNDRLANAFDVSPNGQRAVIGYRCLGWERAACTMRLLEIGNDRLSVLGTHPGGSVWCLDFDSRGSRLASGCYDGEIAIWDVNEGRSLYRWDGDGGNIYSIAMSPHDETLATASWDGYLKLWDVSGNSAPERPRKTIKVIWPGGLVARLRFSPSGRYLAAANANGTVYVFDVILR